MKHWHLRMASSEMPFGEWYGTCESAVLRHAILLTQTGASLFAVTNEREAVRWCDEFGTYKHTCNQAASQPCNISMFFFFHCSRHSPDPTAPLFNFFFSLFFPFLPCVRWCGRFVKKGTHELHDFEPVKCGLWKILCGWPMSHVKFYANKPCIILCRYNVVCDLGYVSGMK